MRKSSTSSILLTRNILSAAIKAGADKAALLAAVGLEPALLDDPLGRVVEGVNPRLLAAAIRLTGDELLGLHCGMWATPDPDNLHAFLVLNSPTLRVAIQNATGYYRMLADDTYQECIESKTQTRLILRTNLPIPLFPRSIAEWVLSNWSTILRVMGVMEFAFQEVRVQHEETRFTEAYEDYFRAPVRFGQPHNELVFASDLLDRPLPNAQPIVADLAERKAVEVLSAIGQPENLHGEVYRALMALLKTSPPSQDKLAQTFGLTQRTLQRRLKERGITYRDVLDTVRRDLSIELLQNRGISIADVAYQIGFADQGNFYRAFSRWFDATPKTYRVRQEQSV